MTTFDDDKPLESAILAYFNGNKTQMHLQTKVINPTKSFLTFVKNTLALFQKQQKREWYMVLAKDVVNENKRLNIIAQLYIYANVEFQFGDITIMACFDVKKDAIGLINMVKYVDDETQDVEFENWQAMVYLMNQPISTLHRLHRLDLSSDTVLTQTKIQHLLGRSQKD